MNRQEQILQVAEKYGSTTDKLFMTIEEAEMLAIELAHRIANSYPDVDCVVGIANGGLMASSIVAQELNVPMEILDIRRRGSYFKRLVYRSERLRAIVARLYRFPLVRFPMYWLMRTMETPIVKECHSVENFDSIAIVDDAVESGKTLAAAVQVIADQSDTNPITAVLCCSREYSTPAIMPDIFMGRRIQHYPWSGNSPQYDEYIKWLKDRGIELSG